MTRTWIMRVVLCLAVQGVVASGLVDLASPTNAGPRAMELVFSDEFEDAKLSMERWNIGLNPGNILYGDSSCAYRRQNIIFTNGIMVFVAREEPEGVEAITPEGSVQYAYSSGAVNTGDKFFLRQNMYVELRVKFPLNNGGFCNFWSMPSTTSDSSYIDPTERMEIHFFDFVTAARKRRFSSGLWFNDYLGHEIPVGLDKKDWVKVGKNHYIITNQRRKGNWGADTSIFPMFQWYEWYEWNDFVTIGFMASSKKMEWFFSESGRAWEKPPYLSYSGANVQSVDHVLSKEEALDDIWWRGVPQVLENSLILNYSIGDGEWVGGPIRKEQLPARMEIDYIRVYQPN